jgi:hypothetical protein
MFSLNLVTTPLFSRYDWTKNRRSVLVKGNPQSPSSCAISMMILSSSKVSTGGLPLFSPCRPLLRSIRVDLGTLQALLAFLTLAPPFTISTAAIISSSEYVFALFLEQGPFSYTI